MKKPSSVPSLPLCKDCSSYNSLKRSLESANRIIEYYENLIELNNKIIYLIADVSLN